MHTLYLILFLLVIVPHQIPLLLLPILDAVLISAPRHTPSSMSGQQLNQYTFDYQTAVLLYQLTMVS